MNLCAVRRVALLYPYTCTAFLDSILDILFRGATCSAVSGLAGAGKGRGHRQRPSHGGFDFQTEFQVLPAPKERPRDLTGGNLKVQQRPPVFGCVARLGQVK